MREGRTDLMKGESAVFFLIIMTSFSTPANLQPFTSLVKVAGSERSSVLTWNTCTNERTLEYI